MNTKFPQKSFAKKILCLIKFCYQNIYNLLNKQSYFIVLSTILFSFSAVGKEKVLDLGAIEIQGEVRRPNIKLVYSKKKYFNKALSAIAKDELRAFEKELLKPASRKDFSDSLK